MAGKRESDGDASVPGGKDVQRTEAGEKEGGRQAKTAARSSPTQTARETTMAHDAKKEEPRKAAAERAMEEERERNERHARTPIVGIGASAGGLEALRELFEHMPVDSGLAFVVIQHLDPHHESLMVDLLGRCTAMTVKSADEGTLVEPDHVYVIPPNTSLTVEAGILHLAKPVERRGVRMPIDQFFRSLAADRRERAVCIVLSGTASEGAQGLREIKAQGGMAMVQDPETAHYDGMPRAAVATGVVDFVLPVSEMPEALLRYVAHPYFREGPQAGESPPGGDEVVNVLSLLRARTGHDFRGYKRSTMVRRIQRRLGLHQIEKMDDYLEVLRREPDEVEALFRDLLVNVTSFFREPEAWAALTEQVIPEVVTAGLDKNSIRVWVPGCASGMEAYSIAILLVEELERRQATCTIQIFATDIDQDALEEGRAALYTADITSDVSAERLERFFRHEGDKYRVVQQLREMVVFAPQNILGDPPFSRLDLVSCRNLLIYIDVEMQRKVLPLLHFALADGGYLFLGSSESISRNGGLFETVSKKWRIFRKLPRSSGEAPAMPPLLARTPTLPPGVRVGPRAPGVGEIANQILAERFAPTALIIDQKFDVLYFHGDTDDYLRQPVGEPTRELAALLRESFRGRIRGAVSHAFSKKESVTVRITLPDDDGRRSVAVTARPLLDNAAAQGLLLLPFEPFEQQQPALAEEPVDLDQQVVKQLEFELQSTREELQSTIEELETANEELKASNEEVMSMNEELQSSNEELETSKEELQSVNEELSTVNAQLQEKVLELEGANNDLANLLSSTDIATLFLDTSLRIRRFTPVTAQLLNVIPGDVGRPLSNIASELNDPSLPRDARQVLDKLVPIEQEVGTSEGRCYLRRLLPFRTRDNRIDGVVLTFTDITEIKRVTADRAALAAIVDTTSDAIISKDLDGTVRSWNRGAEMMYGYSADAMIGRSIEIVIPPEDRRNSTKALARAAEGKTVRSEERRRRKDGTLLNVELALAPVVDPQGKVIGVSSIARDITEARRAARELAESEARFRATGELVPFGCWLCNAAGECTLVTKPFLEATGRTLEKLQGFGWLDLVPEEERGPLIDAWMQCVESGKDWDYEYSFRGADGTMKTAATKGRAVRNEDGQIAFWAGFHLDVTDRRRLERELQALNEELEHRVELRTAQLRSLAVELSQAEQRERGHLSQVLHDGLQQLVVGARMRVDLAQDRSEDNEIRAQLQEVRDLLDEALKASQNLVLELAPPVVQTADLRSVLDWLTTRVHAQFGLDVEVMTAGELPAVSPEHRPMILRGVRELLFNVAKHSGVEHAEIHVRAADGVLEIAVVDNGKGFDPASASSASPSAFGLFSVQEQLRRLGGDLVLDSEPGRGARVAVRLPLVPDPSAKGTDATAEPAAAPARGNRVRVLIVDDDEAVRRALAGVLGLEPRVEVVGLAANGEEGVALALESRPDVVIMDVSMEGLNGVDATRAVKTELPETRVIGLSMHDDPEVAARMRAAGASDYFVKGGDEEELIAAILACDPVGGPAGAPPGP